MVDKIWNTNFFAFYPYKKAGLGSHVFSTIQNLLEKWLQFFKTINKEKPYSTITKYYLRKEGYRRQ